MSEPSPQGARGAINVKLGTQTKVVFPGDKPDDRSNDWFLDVSRESATSPIQMPEPATGNEVLTFIGGIETYNAMADALQTTLSGDASNYFIYMTNWWVNGDLNLRRTSRTDYTPNTGLLNFLQSADNAGVMVRAMFWNRTLGEQPNQNKKEYEFIDGLKNGAAVWDSRHNTVGSHHMKLLVINGKDGLIAFCGGLDFNYDRIWRAGDKPADLSAADLKDHPSLEKDGTLGGAFSDGAPLFDLHARVRGPGALQLMRIFEDRWEDYAYSGKKWLRKALPSSWDTKVKIKNSIDFLNQPWRGDVQVRVGCTFGDNPNVDDVPVAGKFSQFPYQFAPRGKQSGRAQIINGIRKAKNFIYVEDQYLVSDELADEIAKALNRGVKYCISLVPHSTISTDMVIPHTSTNAGVAARKDQVIDRINGALNNSNAGAFYCFDLLDPDGPGHFTKDQQKYRYIHSKVWIFDDEFCTIGSTNMNFRSTTHDSELATGYYDVIQSGKLNLHFAHAVRMKLWANHFGMADSSPLLDWKTAVEEYWLKAYAGQSIPGVTPLVEKYDATSPDLNTEMKGFLQVADPLPGIGKYPIP